MSCSGALVADAADPIYLDIPDPNSAGKALRAS